MLSPLTLWSLGLLLVAALLIWMEDCGPVFYPQWRSGLIGVPFRLLKLRAMRPSPHDSSSWTQPGDRRITCIGQLLRRIRLSKGVRPWKPSSNGNRPDHLPALISTGAAKGVTSLQYSSGRAPLQQGFWGGAQAGEEQMGRPKRLATMDASSGHLHDPAGADPGLTYVLWSLFGA